MRSLAVVVVVAAVAAACTKTGPAQCPSLQRPSARSQVDAVLDPSTNQIYALGGQGAQLPLDELWRYSFGACGGWSHLVLASSPGPRANYAAALDDMRSRIVYIGGGATNDVWSLDTNRLTFTKLLTTGAAPLVAASEVAAYDAMHDRVVYAGIETYALEFGRTDMGEWVFVDGQSLTAPASAVVDPTRSLLVAYDKVGLHGFSFLTSTWHDIAIGSGGAPPAGTPLVWNQSARQLVAVAGDTVSTITLDANATTATFTPLTTTNPPPPRSAFAVAISGTVVWLSGGVTASGCPLDDLWTLEFDTGVWTNVWPATTCL